MESEPVRGDWLGFARAVNCTSALPAEPGDATVSQLGSFVVDDQPQALAAVTPTEPEPPDAGAVPVEDCRL
jgi:hypothetical protein